jgi:DNA-binding MurR/RpiR family transcriptional regulator
VSGPEKKDDTFFKRLEEHYCDLSMKQIRLAEYLRASYKTAVFLNCIPLGKNAGVSEATVIRFAQVLGYTGFTDMIDHVKEYVKFEMTAAEKFEGYQRSVKKQTTYEEVLDTNLHLMKNFSQHVSAEQINQIVFEMIDAKKVVVCTFEGLAGLGEFFVYHLKGSGCRAELMTEKSGRLYDFYNEFQEGTYVINIDFAPYVNSQLKITDLLAKRGAKFCTITDSPYSPLSKHGGNIIYIPFKRDTVDFNIERYPVVLTLFEMIIFQYACCNGEKTRESLKLLNEYNKVFDVLTTEKNF